MTTAESNQDSPLPDDGLDLGKIALVVLGFAILYFVTALLLSLESTVVDSNVSADQPVGPIKVEDAQSVYRVAVTGSLPDQSWRYVEVELQDLEGSYLLSFGKELWRESGRDSDGPWREAELDFDTKITIPEPGDYLLGFNVEGAGASESGATDFTATTRLHVRVYEVGGSSIPHMVVGILLIAVGLVLNEMKNLTISRIIRGFKMLND